MRLQHCLPALLEKIVSLFDLKGKDRYHLRERIVIRTDGAGGTPRIIGMLDPFGFSYFLKGYSYKVAQKVCDAVLDRYVALLSQTGIRRIIHQD